MYGKTSEINLEEKVLAGSKLTGYQKVMLGTAEIKLHIQLAITIR
jgi:hypothetical protein